SGTVIDPNGILLCRADSVLRLSPAIAFNGNRFFAVWANTGPTSSITGRFIDTNGQPAESLRVYSSSNSIMSVRIVFDGTNFLVVWVETSTPYLIKGQRVSATGNLIGVPIQISTTSVAKGSIGLCFDGTNYCVTWADNQIWGRKVDRNGSPVDSAFRVSSSTNTQINSDIVPGANNRYLNVWSEYRGSNTDIYGNLDITINSISEKEKVSNTSRSSGPTIVKDFLLIPGLAKKPVPIFDASGCLIGLIYGQRFNCTNLKPGVYFLPIRDRTIIKIVKID
ncbi:MAG: hypothetical protein ABIL05_05620, partial [candidate division WOR-3 bacterium]